MLDVPLTIILDTFKDLSAYSTAFFFLVRVAFLGKTNEKRKLNELNHIFSIYDKNI